MSTESEAFKRELEEMVKKAALALSEHCCTVQIFVTKYSVDGDGNSMAYEYGVGPYYTRLGQVSEYLTIQQEYQREWAREKNREEED